MWAYIPSLLDFPPTTTPTPSIWVTIERQAELPVPCSMFPLSVCENKILDGKKLRTECCMQCFNMYKVKHKT